MLISSTIFFSSAENYFVTSLLDHQLQSVAAIINNSSVK